MKVFQYFPDGLDFPDLIPVLFSSGYQNYSMRLRLPGKKEGYFRFPAMGRIQKRKISAWSPVGPASISSAKMSHINIKRMTWRSVFTNVPCIKLMLRIRFTLVNSSPSILYVFLFRRSTSCCGKSKAFYQFNIAQ